MAELGFHWPSLIVYLVNFTILLVVLYLVAYKPILRVLDQRSERIRGSLDQADRLQQESAVRQTEMEGQLQEARREGQVFIEQARAAAERFREEERERARQEADAFVARARSDIQRERGNNRRRARDPSVTGP